jgi:hypothetical protein
MNQNKTGPAAEPTPEFKTMSITIVSENAWQQVESVLSKHFHKCDLEAARVFLSAVAAHRLKGQPVWPMLVAPPGSGKTDLLSGFAGLAGVHFIDSLTPRTFISGKLPDPNNPNDPAASLLHRIGSDGILVIPDFSTILAMKHEDKASILADLRRIFDGELSKQFGTGQHVPAPWRGRLTVVVAVTPDIDGHYSVFQTLGERFVMVRWSRADGIQAALRAMNQDRGEVKKDIGDAVQRLMTGLPSIEPELPHDYQLKLAALAEVAVRGRTHVQRSGYNKEIVYVPEPESPTRMAQQLAQLSRGSALIGGRPVVSESDYQIAQRAAFDSMPPARRKILDTLIAGENLKALRMPGSTLSYAQEELQAQGLLERPGREYKLSTDAVDWLEQAGIAVGAQQNAA